MNRRGSIHLVFTAVLGLLAAGAALWAVGDYNDMVARNEEVSKRWSVVESQYQRRMDLIPNLVETVKGAAGFEKSTLTAVVQARSRAGELTPTREMLDDPESFRKFEDAQSHLSTSLSRLLVVMERYPDIRTSEAYRELLSQLEGTENAIQSARQDYNAAAQGISPSAPTSRPRRSPRGRRR